ncbi:hypothetical protein QBC33DRAFT_66096 [Phialemonium atrogriseum]|uniref:Secreted protein n=1 Tax=Phialemonium atrogriseum TaxID=1093897 RepID=A0AAJ0BZV2_9PEZI|nr:uncharacterized protein QBC33DRAFT_66096 [Phialemonium atrogriseum]KAK1767350.1 hypothetical protein QBC33DRAFT_66096 [Phialemonium atrogriseum]
MTTLLRKFCRGKGPHDVWLSLSLSLFWSLSETGECSAWVSNYIKGVYRRFWGYDYLGGVWRMGRKDGFSLPTASVGLHPDSWPTWRMLDDRKRRPTASATGHGLSKRGAYCCPGGGR